MTVAELMEELSELDGDREVEILVHIESEACNKPVQIDRVSLLTGSAYLEGELR